MIVLPLVFDGDREYEGYFGSPARCRLRIYATAGRPAVAIASELPDNRDTSVTNRAEVLATLTLCRAALMYRSDPGEIVRVEHHPGRPGDTIPACRVDRYALVEFDRDGARFCRPRWSPAPESGSSP